MQFQITFTVYSFVTESMFEMLQSFEHKFEISEPRLETVEVDVGYGRRASIMGQQKPVTITMHDENDALMFKLKFFNEVYESSRTYTEQGGMPWESN